MTAHVTRGRGLAMFGAALIATTVMALPASAWEPTEELEMVIHASPTSDINFFVRTVEQILKPMLPHGANAVNITGAGGDRARRYIVERVGNPHVVKGLTPSQVSNSILQAADYGVDNFTALAVMAVSPSMICVNAASNYHTMDDLIEAARAKPGAIVQGGGDVGEVDSLHHVMLSELANVRMTFTPFESKGIAELLGGHIDFVMVNPAQCNPYVKSGDFRILAASAPLEAHPKVPTLAAAGYDIPILRQYRGLWMPAGVPAEARDYYIGLLKQVAETEKFKTYAASNDLIVSPIWGDDLTAMLKAEEASYRSLLTKLGLIR